MFGYGDWLLAARIDQRLKGAVPYISAFEDAVARNARRLSFAGVVCGHIHYCEVASMGDGVYSNCGEWVESCTAWVEHDDGRIELRHCFTPGRQSDPATVEALATKTEPCPSEPIRACCALASAWHSGQILLGASLRLALTGLACGQSPSAPGGWVGDCDTSMVVAMCVEQPPGDAVVGRAQSLHGFSERLLGRSRRGQAIAAQAMSVGA